MNSTSDIDRHITEIDEAIQKGLAFLARNQLEDGSFNVVTSKSPDMQGALTPDPSVFPTALVIQCLEKTSGIDTVRKKALDFIVNQQDTHGLWRYWTNAHPRYRELPPDLDDTSCASRALIVEGRTPHNNRDVLLNNRNEQGLFYTWALPRPRLVGSLTYWRAVMPQLRHLPTLIFLFCRTQAKPSDIDAVVNANVLYYLGSSKATYPIIYHLLKILEENRETQCDKWYENPFVIWYFFSRALSSVSIEAGDIILPRLQATKPAHILDIALSILVQLKWQQTPQPETLIELLNGQLDSGAWPPAAISHGGRRRRPGGGFDLPKRDTPYWGSEELTTAFCIEALTLCKRIYDLKSFNNFK
jgi:hypothetical protein